MRNVDLNMIAGVLFLLITSNSHAKIIAQSTNHFVVANEIIFMSNDSRVIQQEVWQQLVKINQWWEGEHSYSGEVKNLYLDLRKERCFCEKWQQGWVEHMRVVNVIEQKKLILTGGLGPLQSQSINGVLDINIAADKGGLVLKWSYRVYGAVDQGLDKWAAAVDGVLENQFYRLNELVKSNMVEVL